MEHIKGKLEIAVRSETTVIDFIETDVPASVINLGVFFRATDKEKAVLACVKHRYDSHDALLDALRAIVSTTYDIQAKIKARKAIADAETTPAGR